MKKPFEITGVILLAVVSCESKDAISPERYYPEEKTVEILAENAFDHFYHRTKSSGFTFDIIEPLVREDGDTTAVN